MTISPCPTICQRLFGQLFADKGYLARWLTETLARQNLQLITSLRKNMTPVPRTGLEKTILRCRSLIETIFDELKNLCQIEHIRHCSLFNFLINLMAGIVAYCLSDNRPTLNLTKANSLEHFSFS